MRIRRRWRRALALAAALLLGACAAGDPGAPGSLSTRLDGRVDSGMSVRVGR